MKQVVFLVGVILWAVSIAGAQEISQGTGIVGNGRYLGAKTYDGQGTVGVLGVDSAGNTQVNANSGSEASVAVAMTPIAAANGTTGFRLKKSGTGFNFAVPYVPTLAATPAAGTNDFKPGPNVVPTAALNAAAGLPAVPTPGDTYEIFNAGPNAVRVKAYGTPGINGGSAGVYIPLATKQAARCIAESASNWNCSVDTVPTPAGP